MIKTVMLLISTLTQRPALFTEHGKAYAALLRQETMALRRAMIMRAMAYLSLALSAMLFLSFSGVALMLGLLFERSHWILFAVPASALLPICLFLYAVNRASRWRGFAETRMQIKQDLNAICLAAKQ